MIDKLFELDQAVFNFSDEGKLWLDIVIGFIMFGIALGLKSSDFKILVSNPKPILLGFLSQFVLMPILTFFISNFLKSIYFTFYWIRNDISSGMPRR